MKTCVISNPLIKQIPVKIYVNQDNNEMNVIS